MVTWKGFVYVAFVIDVFSLSIVGWRGLNSIKTDLILDAFEQALHACSDTDGFVHHSDRRTQYLSIRYSERLADCRIQALVGSKRGVLGQRPHRIDHRLVKGRGDPSPRSVARC